MDWNWRGESIGALWARKARGWWHQLDRPDPWSEDVQRSVDEADARPVCHRCALPQEHAVWFCPECGVAVGPYNNLLPFIRNYSIGEVVRSSLDDHARYSWLTVPGYLTVFSMLGPLNILLPVYWIRVFRRYIEQRKEDSGRHEMIRPFWMVLLPGLVLAVYGQMLLGFMMLPGGDPVPAAVLEQQQPVRTNYDEGMQPGIAVEHLSHESAHEDTTKSPRPYQVDSLDYGTSNDWTRRRFEALD